MKTNLIIVLVAGAIAVLFGQIGLSLRDNFVTRSNTKVLEDIVFNTLSRTERSIDHSLDRIGSLYAGGKINCGPQSGQVIDDLILKSSNIKEVAFLDNGVQCGTSANSRVMTDATAAFDNGIAARDDKLAFKVAKVDDLTGLVMTWDLSDSKKVAVFMNTEGLVFDALPPAIRDVANLEVSMLDGTMLGFLRMDGQTAPDDIAINLASERYPLKVRLTMSQAAMVAWRTQLPFITQLFGGLALFGIGLLMARGFLSPVSSAQSIRRALKNGSILPYYQPVYGVRTGELTGFEVLARRIDKDGVLLSPATFIPLIEKYNLGDQLLEVLMRHSAKHMDAIIDQSQLVTLAFNVTPRQLARDGFVTWFIELLTRTQMPTDRIVLEVTEREAIADLGNLQKNISQLRDLDITIAIDDVGTGHNGLSSIHQLRADYLKIDKLFVDGIVMDKHASALVKMLIDIGAQYGMQIIAEGVETEEQLNALRELGVDEVQGFYMARPMPATDAVIEFAHHRAVRTKVMLAEGLRRPADAPDNSLTRSA